MGVLKTINHRKNRIIRHLKGRLLARWLNLQYFRQPPELTRLRHILLLRLDDKAGDMVVTTFTARHLADQGYKVSVLTGPVCGQMLSGCDYLEKIFLYKNRMSLHQLRAEKFGAVIDFDDVHDYERLKLLWRLGAECNIGFNKDGLKIYHYSLAHLDADTHITARHRKVLALFSIYPQHTRYFLGGSPQEREKVCRALSYSPGESVIAINPLSGAPDKDFSVTQVQAIIAYLRRTRPDSKIVITGIPQKVREFAGPGVCIIPDSTINTAIETVRIAELVISTDTSIVHIANALNRNLLAVYNRRRLKDTGLPGYKIWAPNYAAARQIVVSEPQVRDAPVDAILTGIEAFLNRGTGLRQDAQIAASPAADIRENQGK